MPELPEVETVRNGLSEHILGYRIHKLIELHPRVRKPTSIAPLSDLVGARIEEINRRGKFLWLRLDRPEVLVAHLGMSGQFLFPEKSKPYPKHSRAIFELRKGGRNQELVFNDQRTFGWLSVENTVDGIPTSVSHIAADPFDIAFEKTVAIRNLARRKMRIKPALLNQGIISGIGNIYADEALWRARVHPETLANQMSMRKIELVIESATQVMSEAIAKGGTTFDDMYVNVNGESGYFERSLNAYGQTDLPCPRCGTPIRRIIVSQRSAHFCPRCQRKPK